MLRILVPVDGSEHDSRTLSYISKLLPGRADVEVVLLNAIDLQLLPTEADITGMPVFLPPSEIEGQQQAAQQQAQKVVTGAQAIAKRLNLAARTEIRWGDPATVIVDCSKDGEAYDLIALGSRGAGQIAGIFLGSVSDRVVHRAQIPVLIVR